MKAEGYLRVILLLMFLNPLEYILQGSYCANNIKTECDAGYTTDATGATDISQCYTECTVDCEQSTCPENATCEYGNETATGTQNWGGTCNAVAPTCSVTSVACDDGLELVDGKCRITTPEFIIKTTEISSDFQFTISAKGRYYIDWGDGNFEPINKTNTEIEPITHTYTPGNSYTIHMSGNAVAYNSADYVAAISFKDNTQIASVDGSLGAIFGGGTKYMFNATFQNCTSLTEISNNLFAGVDTAYESLFNSTFDGCTSLVEIPAGLFAGVSGTAPNMFRDVFTKCERITYVPANLFANVSDGAYGLFANAFAGCTGLQTIYSNMFSSISNAAERMFMNTFDGCSSLSEIPAGLFDSVMGSQPYMYYSTFKNCSALHEIPTGLFNNVDVARDRLFYFTFNGCSSLDKIPDGLFSHITGSATRAFDRTFAGCSALTYIPSDLFAGIRETADNMFNGTFKECTSLTRLPSGLFRNIGGDIATNAFYQTFYKDTNLTGYVPTDLFQTLVDDGIGNQYAQNYPTGNGPMAMIFSDTALATQCPVGMYQYITGFESDWNGKVSCVPCPSGMLSPAGSVSVDQCSTVVRLHIGDDVVMNLVSARPTTSPVMVFQVGDTPYYAPMSATETPINSDTNVKYRVLYNETEYWVHDYTAQ